MWRRSRALPACGSAFELARQGRGAGDGLLKWRRLEAEGAGASVWGSEGEARLVLNWSTHALCGSMGEECRRLEKKHGI